ncbi:MAG: sodium:glutamate symporter [Planctomycetota bacterium]|nr:sodium:glutamate symporter [Planctomycetota bacterium]
MQNAFLAAAGLLLIGFVLRVKLRVLQVLFIPASIAGGLVGLAVVQTVQALHDDSIEPSWLNGCLNWIAGDLVQQLKPWPGWLIAVVFAGLFLERKSRPFRNSIRQAGREGLVVWIIVLGQTALGLLATWLLIQPNFDVPNSFGMLIETGFAGGHGTAAAMGPILENDPVNLDAGLDLGIFMATIGLVFSVVSGIVYVNLAVRRGWTRAGNVEIPKLNGLESRHDPQPVARGTVRSEVIDPMVFQTLIMATAVVVGLLLHTLVMLWFPSTENFPLFIYTLIGGLLVRRTMDALDIGDLIDSASIRRLSSAAMEFLVVSAIVSLNVQAVVGLIGPLSILLVVAFVWTGFCLLYVSRRLLPVDYWFELGIINYGMSTGTTATGLVLLRIIDKDMDSGAAEDFAMAAPLSAPFIGGGVITFMLPFQVLEHVHIGISALGLCVLVAVLYFAGLAWMRHDHLAVVRPSE